MMDVICAEGTFTGIGYQIHEAVQVVIPKAEIVISAGGRSTMVLTPGMIYVTAPLELRAMRGIDHGPFTACVMLVSPAAIPVILSHELIVRDGDLHAVLMKVFHELSRPLAERGCVTRLRDCLADLPASPGARGCHDGKAVAPSGVTRARDHLCAHAAEDVSLEALAASAGLSKFYLSRAFVRAYGLTPHAYHMQLRLARARRLLAEGHPLSHVTYDAGFADQSHLTRRFAAFHRLTPARFARALMAPVV